MLFGRTFITRYTGGMVFGAVVLSGTLALAVMPSAATAQAPDSGSPARFLAVKEWVGTFTYQVADQGEHENSCETVKWTISRSANVPVRLDQSAGSGPKARSWWGSTSFVPRIDDKMTHSSDGTCPIPITTFVNPSRGIDSSGRFMIMVNALTGTYSMLDMVPLSYEHLWGGDGKTLIQGSFPWFPMRGEGTDIEGIFHIPLPASGLILTGTKRYSFLGSGTSPNSLE